MADEARLTRLLTAIDPALAAESDAGDVDMEKITDRAVATVAASKATATELADLRERVAKAIEELETWSGASFGTWAPWLTLNLLRGDAKEGK